jgi:four helix bundle protein
VAFKFENLEVWQLSLEYSDKIYEISEKFPAKEQYNLTSQMLRATTSISLNIAEGSTSQSDMEFRRFVGIAIRSLIEAVGRLHLAKRRKYVDEKAFNEVYVFGEKMFAKLQALRKKLK